MKTVFLNPFLPTDLNEKVTSVSFKIGSFDYIAKHADVKTTEIDFDKRIIQINDALDSTASLRELVRAFFIIVAYELNLNAEFPNSKKAHLDDIAMAHLSFLFTHWWDDSTFNWEYNTDYPKTALPSSDYNYFGVFNLGAFRPEVAITTGWFIDTIEITVVDNSHRTFTYTSDGSTFFDDDFTGGQLVYQNPYNYNLVKTMINAIRSLGGEIIITMKSSTVDPTTCICDCIINP